MKRQAGLLVLVLAALAPLAAAQRDADAARAAQEAEQGLKAALGRVVLIRADFDGSPVVGAGLIVGRSADLVYVVTADHVVRRGATLPSRVTVALRQRPGAQREIRLLPQRDAELDLALLAIPDVAVTEADLCADSFFVLEDKDIQRGHAVLPVGHPNGVRWFLPVTSDAVASVENGEVNFQSTVLAPGHSGGPLMTRDGYWVGIVTADSPPFGRAASAEAVLRRLLEWGVPVLMHNIGHQNIVRAIKSVEPVTLRKLLQICDASQWGAEIGRSSFIRMPMEYALRTRNVAVVRELLRAGVRPDAEINFTETVLHRAAKQGLDEIVAELLAAGAKPDLKNHEGTTPLMLAAALGRIETVRVLLAAGADPGLRDESGRSAHMQARTPEVAKLLATRAPAPR